MRQSRGPHPVFDLYKSWEGTADPGFDFDFIGAKTRDSFFTQITRRPSSRLIRNQDPPSIDEEYFEWIDLLQSVAEAANTFTMIELGAGWGRWLVRGALAARQGADIHDVHLVGVEAEATHYEWMLTHFRDNDLNPSGHTLINAAVAADAGRVKFQVGLPEQWYGQQIVEPNDGTPLLRRLKQRFRYFQSGRRVRTVSAVTLPDLLNEVDMVNLVDLDVQGAEAGVLQAAGTMLTRKVRRVHVGTHGAKVEGSLRNLFKGLGWECSWDFPGSSTSMTPWGKVDFDDGVQTWTNPTL